MRIDKAKIDIFLSEKGMKKKELSSAIGTTPSYLSIILNRGTGAVATVVKIANALDVDPIRIVKEG